jgi:hypothetical protein
MKIKQILAVLTILPVSLIVSTSRADDFSAIQSGNWSDTNTWLDNTTVTNGTVPGINDDADIAFGFDVTVDTNISVQYIYDYGTVTMGTNSSLNLFNDLAIATSITLDATATGNTVIYSANPFFALQTNYYNLVFATTNYVQPIPPYGALWEDFNNFSSAAGPTPMTIAGDWTLMGAVKVQQGSGGAPITIDGNLIIGAGCAWDCSGDVLTVVSNAYVYGLLEDLNGSLGTNYIGGNVIVAGASTSIPAYPASGHNPAGNYTNGWYVSDITTWGVGGSLTNDGAIYGLGFGSIIFDGTGSITGTNILTIPTMTVNGTSAIGTSITLITNTPTLNGTLVFDIANPKQITLLTNAGTALYYSGNLNVINSGSPPASGAMYQLFNSTNGYAGSFSATNFPSLQAGLSWIDNTLTSGSIAVTGAVVGAPTLTLSKSGGVLILSWDSTTFPGYSVQGQTNIAGIHSNWGPTGSGTVSPFNIAINPANPPVFFRLYNP